MDATKTAGSEQGNEESPAQVYAGNVRLTNTLNNMAKLERQACATPDQMMRSKMLSTY